MKTSTVQAICRIQRWGRSTVTLKPRKRIKSVSSARAKQRAEYVRLKEKFLKTHENCFACSSWVALVVRELHHFYKRRGRLLTWVPGFRMSCTFCHNTIHFDEPRARERDLLAPKECCDDFKRALAHYEQLTT